MSCKGRNGPELTWPSVKYQVLDGDKNKITFPPYNGLYIFKASVVDTFYSYCDLSVTFSVCAYGVFPMNYLHFWGITDSLSDFAFDFYKILPISFITLKIQMQKLNYFEWNFSKSLGNPTREVAFYFRIFCYENTMEKLGN